MSEDDYVSADAENPNADKDPKEGNGTFNVFKINDSSYLRRNKINTKMP